MNLLAFVILIVGVASRIFTHLPNFTPVVALALFGGAYLKKEQAVIVPLLLMIISDCVIGFHDTFLFTWGSVAAVALLGLHLRERKSAGSVLVYSLSSAVLFFIVTNFGAWPALYPHTAAGLLECYVAAIPFFRYTLISTLVYSIIFFGAYEGIAARVKETSLARIWLS